MPDRAEQWSRIATAEQKTIADEVITTYVKARNAINAYTFTALGQAHNAEYENNRRYRIFGKISIVLYVIGWFLAFWGKIFEKKEEEFFVD
jgi:hypothetical protein